MPKFTRRFLFSKLVVFLVLFAVFAVLTTNALTAQAQPANGTVIIAQFNVPVDPGSAAFMTRVVSTAQSQHAVAIIIEMNTPGGLLSDMINIVSSITIANQSGIPTYTFIVPNGLGASAGSYIAMATNQIIMAPGSEIGPSTPIVIGGSELQQNHTQAAMLDYMISLAENWNRNTTAVYGMVQSNQAFSANEAITIHVADSTAASLTDALNQLGLASNPQTTLSENLYGQLISTPKQHRSGRHPLSNRHLGHSRGCLSPNHNFNHNRRDFPHHGSYRRRNRRRFPSGHCYFGHCGGVDCCRVEAWARLCGNGGGCVGCVWHLLLVV